MKSHIIREVDQKVLCISVEQYVPDQYDNIQSFVNVAVDDIVIRRKMTFESQQDYPIYVEDLTKYLVKEISFFNDAAFLVCQPLGETWSSSAISTFVASEVMGHFAESVRKPTHLKIGKAEQRFAF